MVKFFADKYSALPVYAERAMKNPHYRKDSSK
jgi:hypothetical protein